MSTPDLEFIVSAGGLNNSHTYPIFTPNQPLNDILRYAIPRII